MTTVSTLDNQSLLDIAIQELGDVERVFELAVDNDISITDVIAPGTEISIGVFESEKRMIVSVFSDKSNAPASIDNMEDVLPTPNGIGFMQIGNDFKVR